MSSEEPQTKTSSEINKYVFIFIAFVAVVVAAYSGIRYNNSHAISKTETQKKADEVVLTKDPMLAEKKHKLLQDLTGDYYLGEKYAPVVVIEYASLACPHCRELQETVIEPLIPNYVDKGKVKYVFRDFPHNEAALPAAKLAHCADPERYFSFIKVLFKSQDQWAYNKDYLTILKNIAKLGGVTDEQFDRCMADKNLENQILNTVKNASDILGVHSVPTIYINGNEYAGKRDYASVSAYIDKLLSGNDATTAPAQANGAVEAPAAPAVPGRYNNVKVLRGNQ